MNEVAPLLIQIQTLRDQCWKAHISKNKAEALELAVKLRTAAQQLAEELK